MEVSPAFSHPSSTCVPEVGNPGPEAGNQSASGDEPRLATLAAVEGEAEIAAVHSPDDPAPPVIARIPNVDADELWDEQAADRPRPGRLVSQKMSVKLLAVGGVLLLAAAVTPFIWSGGSRDTKQGEGQPDWHPGPPAPTAEVAPAWKPEATRSAQTAPHPSVREAETGAPLAGPLAGSAEQLSEPPAVGGLAPQPFPAGGRPSPPEVPDDPRLHVLTPPSPPYGSPQDAPYGSPQDSSSSAASAPPGARQASSSFYVPGEGSAQQSHIPPTPRSSSMSMGADVPGVSGPNHYQSDKYDHSRYDPGRQHPGSYAPAGSYESGEYEPGGYESGGYESRGSDPRGYRPSGSQPNAYEPRQPEYRPFDTPQQQTPANYQQQTPYRQQTPANYRQPAPANNEVPPYRAGGEDSRPNTAYPYETRPYPSSQQYQTYQQYQQRASSCEQPAARQAPPPGTGPYEQDGYEHRGYDPGTYTPNAHDPRIPGVPSSNPGYVPDTGNRGDYAPSRPVPEASSDQSRYAPAPREPNAYHPGAYQPRRWDTSPTGPAYTSSSIPKTNMADRRSSVSPYSRSYTGTTYTGAADRGGDYSLDYPPDSSDYQADYRTGYSTGRGNAYPSDYRSSSPGAGGFDARGARLEGTIERPEMGTRY